MTPFNISAGQWAFFIIVPIVVIAIIGVAIFFILRYRSMKKDFKYHCYKKIYKIAMDRDYYLINNFLFRIDSAHVARIDHILFADKYIYIINDFYVEGDVDGKENDASLIIISKDGKKQYMDNPIAINAKLVNKLSLITGINQSLMIGISLINDDCRCGVQTTSKSSYIIQANRFKQLVKAIESRDIGLINKDQLASAVKAIDKLNRRKRNSGAK